MEIVGRSGKLNSASDKAVMAADINRDVVCPAKHRPIDRQFAKTTRFLTMENSGGANRARIIEFLNS
jgi:hypothetical protein